MFLSPCFESHGNHGLPFHKQTRENINKWAQFNCVCVCVCPYPVCDFGASSISEAFLSAPNSDRVTVCLWVDKDTTLCAHYSTVSSIHTHLLGTNIAINFVVVVVAQRNGLFSMQIHFENSKMNSLLFAVFFVHSLWLIARGPYSLGAMIYSMSNIN